MLCVGDDTSRVVWLAQHQHGLCWLVHRHPRLVLVRTQAQHGLCWLAHNHPRPVLARTQAPTACAGSYTSTYWSSNMRVLCVGDDTSRVVWLLQN